jgi:hypothetical protein
MHYVSPILYTRTTLVTRILRQGIGLNVYLSRSIYISCIAITEKKSTIRNEKETMHGSRESINACDRWQNEIGGGGGGYMFAELVDSEMMMA